MNSLSWWYVVIQLFHTCCIWDIYFPNVEDRYVHETSYILKTILCPLSNSCCPVQSLGCCGFRSCRFCGHSTQWCMFQTWNKRYKVDVPDYIVMFVRIFVQSPKWFNVRDGDSSWETSQMTRLDNSTRWIIRLGGGFFHMVSSHLIVVTVTVPMSI